MVVTEGTFILSFNQSLNSLVITNSGSEMELYFSFKANCWFSGATNYEPEVFWNDGGTWIPDIGIKANFRSLSIGSDGNTAFLNCWGLWYGGKSWDNNPEDSTDFSSSDNVVQTRGLNLTTKDIDFGNPSQTKKIYKLKIKYRHHGVYLNQKIYVGWKKDMGTFEEGINSTNEDIPVNNLAKQSDFTKFNEFDGVSTNSLPSTLIDSTDNPQSSPIDEENPSDFRIVEIKMAGETISCKSIILKIWAEDNDFTDLILDNITIVYREKPIR